MRKVMRTVLGGALVGVVALAYSIPGHAVPENGFVDETDLGGGIFEFLFDTLTQSDGDIHGTADGIVFVYGISGLTLTVTDGALVPTNTDTIQDTVGKTPPLGGLGHDAGSDNLEVGEALKLTFSDPVFLTHVAFNGEFGGNGHEDPADGVVEVSDSDSMVDVLLDKTAGFVGVAGLMGTEFWFTPRSPGPGEPGYHMGIDFVYDEHENDEFSGYIQGIRVTLKTSVPEPATLGLMGLSLLGLGFATRRRRQAR